MPARIMMDDFQAIAVQVAIREGATPGDLPERAVILSVTLAAGELCFPLDTDTATWLRDNLNLSIRELAEAVRGPLPWHRPV